jgi:quercetin dioxygenase-like cupin family protein
MEPYIVIFPQQIKDKLFQHKGEEFVFVLEGKGRMFYGDQEFVVEEGDALYFDGDIPHHGHAEGDKPWKCLTVLFTPS